MTTSKSKRNPTQQIADALDSSDLETTVVTNEEMNELIDDSTDSNTTTPLDNKQLEDYLYAGEAEAKSQLAISIKAYGWQVFQQVGAEYDAHMILEMAHSQMKGATPATKSRLDEISKRVNLKSSEVLQKEIEAKKEAFLKCQKTLQAKNQKALPKSKS